MNSEKQIYADQNLIWVGDVKNIVYHLCAGRVCYL